MPGHLSNLAGALLLRISSRDGTIHVYHPVYYKAVLCACISLASDADMDAKWMDELPPPDDRRLADERTRRMVDPELRVGRAPHPLVEIRNVARAELTEADAGNGLG